MKELQKQEQATTAQVQASTAIEAEEPATLDGWLTILFKLTKSEGLEGDRLIRQMAERIVDSSFYQKFEKKAKALQEFFITLDSLQKAKSHLQPAKESQTAAGGASSTLQSTATPV